MLIPFEQLGCPADGKPIYPATRAEVACSDSPVDGRS
jgi:hypothetical protein